MHRKFLAAVAAATLGVAGCGQDDTPTADASASATAPVPEECVDQWNAEPPRMFAAWAQQNLDEPRAAYVATHNEEDTMILRRGDCIVTVAAKSAGTTVSIFTHSAVNGQFAENAVPYRDRLIEEIAKYPNATIDTDGSLKAGAPG